MPSPREHGLTPGTTFDHVADRFTRLCHRHNCSDLWRDFVCDDELHHGLHFLERAHNRSADVDLLDEDAHQVSLGKVTSGDTVDHDDPAPFDGLETVFPSRGPDIVNDGVCAPWQGVAMSEYPVGTKTFGDVRLHRFES